MRQVAAATARAQKQQHPLQRSGLLQHSSALGRAVRLISSVFLPIPLSLLRFVWLGSQPKRQLNSLVAAHFFVSFAIGVFTMATLFKRGGKGNWLVSWYDHDGVRRNKSTRTTDHAAASRIAAKIEADVQLRKSGVVDTRLDRIAAQAAKPISSHLDDFGAAMRSKSGLNHIDATRKFCEAIAVFGGWKNLRDIEPDSANRFIATMLDAGKAARTVASYIQALKSFTRWAVKSGRLASDPLATVTKPSADGDKRVIRRFLSHNEFRWLDSVCRQSGDNWGMTGSERAMLYSVAIQTGLRSNEIRSLTRGKLHLTSSPPFVMVDAKRTKNSKPARQYIQPELAAELKAHVASKLGGAGVFNMPVREDVAEMLRDDMAAARAVWLATFKEPQQKIEAEASDFLKPLDSEGETLDFHALRHTCASWLIQAGADVKTVQSVLRHSDIKLTLDRYGHLFPGSEAAAVARLRSAFVSPLPLAATGTVGTDNGAQRSRQQLQRQMVQNPAVGCESFDQVIAKATEQKTNETTEETEVSHEKNAVRVLGLEPRTHGLKVRCSTD